MIPSNHDVTALTPFLVRFIKLIVVRYFCRKVANGLLKAFFIHYLSIPEENAAHIAEFIIEGVEKLAEVLHGLLSYFG